MPEVAGIGRGRWLGRRVPQGGSGYPSKVLDAPSRLPRPTAKRRAVLCRPDGVAASVTMRPASLPPCALPDNKCQPVTTASGIEYGPLVGEPIAQRTSRPAA